MDNKMISELYSIGLIPVIKIENPVQKYSANIDSYYASSAAMSEVLDSEGQLAYILTQNGPLVAVTCELKTDSSTRSGYYFSSKKGTELTVSNGDQATVQLVLDKCAPISKVFPMLGGK